MKSLQGIPKWALFAVGGIVLLFVLSRRRSSAPANVTPVTYQQADSGIADSMASVLSAVIGVQEGVAALSQNQITAAATQNQILGASSWLSCCNPVDWHCDANCFKQKGGTTAFIPGSGNVTNLKTQNRDTIREYASPFSSCLSGGGYDFSCVGNILAGSPTYNRITADADLGRAAKIAPDAQPVGTGVI